MKEIKKCPDCNNSLAIYFHSETNIKYYVCEKCGYEMKYEYGGSIKKSGYNTIKDCFKNEFIKLYVTVDSYNKDKWIDELWNDYGDDITEFLYGIVNDNSIDENKLIEQVTCNDMINAIKANEESFFNN